MSRTLSQDTPQNVNQIVSVSGWVNSTRDHGGLIFIDLRDHTGIVQLTIHPEQAQVFKLAETLRDEFVITATGKVVEREKDLVNKNIPTGEVEIVVDSLTVLNPSKPLPFPIQHVKEEINEDLRLRYRFLDLRREKMQKMLLERHKFLKAIRDYMDTQGFVEITTPILTSSSPEGARDFLVPSRLHPGEFYALPQAPQQFKQLLMVGGLPKYFQIAPCFRDEDPRADRHPGEFYQLDLEVAFAQSPEDIFSIVEPMMVEITESFAGKKVMQKPVPRLSYDYVMETYGSDKPDLRYDMKIVDLTEDFTNTEFSVFKNALAEKDGVIKAISCVGGNSLTRSQIDTLTEFVKKEGAGGLAYIQMTDEGPKSPILKYLSEAELNSVISKVEAKAGDIIFFGADTRKLVNKVLGKLRDSLADTFGLKDPNVLAWAFIVDFPMYEWDETRKTIDFGHNPFSMPEDGLESLNNQDPLTIKALQYDIVANGYELCSGAIRNYNPEIMYKAFEIAGYDKETVDQKFGAMIKAFEYGAPPHGGCAFGIDRWFMTLMNEPNIREVIAFPKNGSAIDLMMNAPSGVDDKQLKELHIKLDLPPKK